MRCTTGIGIASAAGMTGGIIGAVVRAAEVSGSRIGIAAEEG